MVRLLCKTVTLHRKEVLVERHRLALKRPLRYIFQTVPNLCPTLRGGHTEQLRMFDAGSFDVLKE
jgi:hypothetical protein